VSNARQIQNLTLIGFMGTGKSSVGHLVADLLRFDFLDTDELIQSRASQSITEIFKQHGEPHFRELERQVVEELRARNKTVISTGGGLPTHGDNLEQLKVHSLVVCLWASPEKIWERVRGQSHRPLLNEPDPLARIRQLLETREPFYRQADVLINTDVRLVREVAHQVVHQFHVAQAAHA